MTDNRENTLVIETPEGIDFSLRLAGPVIRSLAWGIDLGCVGVLTRVLIALMSLVEGFNRDFAYAGFTLTYFVIAISYGIVMEYFWRGQTLGKRIFKLQVMDIQGLSLQLHQVIIRNLLRFLDKLPSVFYMVGGISCLVSRYSQRIGDVAANTIVVWNHRIKRPDLEQLIPDKYNSFHDYPHLEARLRQQITPQEASIALKALVRRHDLEPQARVDLFREIADYFRKIVEFPQEAIDGISDEQYIRNLVDVLFRTGQSTWSK